MSPHSLEPIIRNLIYSKREGDYWDFKAEPHSNNASLLHDLLCLANSLHQGNRYLILGVDDPSKGANVVGLTQGQEGRKTQAQYIDFLRGQKFASGSRPEITMVTLVLDGKEVDVLVVLDTPHKPYWLTEDYSGDKGKVVRAQYIYTRVGDTNTPMTKAADPHHIEKMWRQRFGMDLMPRERMKQLLYQPLDWEIDFNIKKYAYHKHLSDYRVTLSEQEELWEPFSFFFTNKKSFWGTASFAYNATTLFEMDYVYLDEMRLMLPFPETGYVELKDRTVWYYHYNQDLVGGFLTFLTEGRSGFESRGMKAPFLLFKNETDQNAFDAFVQQHEQLLEEADPGYWAQEAAKEMRKAGHEHQTDPIDLGKLCVVYQKWRRGGHTREQL
ncbi:AlbA family DNA-binding domain-containing protein [Hymenobacter jeollabukensis]|uniref:ATP-binding protein n=1 Tax=Hymenobacter jeollabukensis TaxID=2025313 RepID=A0A5R8WJU0_9BACT|nr:ATP-binding protein [Hymenobacter jeollabukensis]TLM88764.1 ATP-binding protein [Hymenobacter jeollabukensis]